MSNNYYAVNEQEQVREELSFNSETTQKQVMKAVSDAQAAASRHIEAQRQITLKDTTGEISDLYSQLVDLLGQTDTEAVQKFYDAGRLIREYFEHHSDAEAKEVIGLFARTCHLKQPVMLAAYKFAKEFDPSEVSMLSGLENSSTGYRLSQTHLLYVMVDYLSDMETPHGIIRGVDRRISYLRRAVEGSLPPIVMRKLIASENKQLTGSGRGRTCRIPGTKNELLADMNEHLGRIVGKINQAWDNPEDPALLKLAMDMGDVSETTRCELIKVMEHLSAIMQFCERAHVTMNEVDGMYVRAINENAPRVVGGTSVDTAVRTLG